MLRTTKLFMVCSLFLSVSMIAGCTSLLIPATSSPTPTVSPTRTASRTPKWFYIPQTPITPTPEPEWLTVTYPRPGKIILLEDFEVKKGMYDLSCRICVEIDASILLEVGNFWEGQDVINRTTFLVDGVRHFLTPQEAGSYYDLLMPHSIRKGNQKVAEVGGPYGFCISKRLRAGIHKVDVSFNKDSGTTPIYSWTFEIVESLPTATPLP